MLTAVWGWIAAALMAALSAGLGAFVRTLLGRVEGLKTDATATVAAKVAAVGDTVASHVDVLTKYVGADTKVVSDAITSAVKSVSTLPSGTAGPIAVAAVETKLAAAGVTVPAGAATDVVNSIVGSLAGMASVKA